MPSHNSFQHLKQGHSHDLQGMQMINTSGQEVDREKLAAMRRTFHFTSPIFLTYIFVKSNLGNESMFLGVGCPPLYSSAK